MIANVSFIRNTIASPTNQHTTMRFNPDYIPDPDPEEEEGPKFQVLDTLDDLPGGKIEELMKFRDKIESMIEHELEQRSEQDPVITYIAFQELKIHALQQEIHNMHKMMITLATAIDRVEGKHE